MSRPPGFKHTDETKRKMRENNFHWNRGLTKETNSSVRQQSISLTKRWENHPHPLVGKIGKRRSGETKLKMSIARQGQKNANWKGGLTQLIKGIRRSPDFYQWRKAVLERDNHTCQDCGAIEELDVHHIQSITDYPEGIFKTEVSLTGGWQKHPPICLKGGGGEWDG